MPKKLVLGNHLVPEILAHLNKLVKLPTEGLLAGQALCSAILDLYCGGGGVYNDIDVFKPASTEKLAELRSDKRKHEDAMTLGIPLAQLDDYEQLCLDSSDGISIAGSDTSGLLNVIWCDVTETDLSPGRLVYSFDLNAVEVALDLHFKELTWSRGFEDFIASRQLEITALTTPERTVLRYLKKREELAAFGNDTLVFDMVASWMAQNNRDTYIHTLTTKALAYAKRFASKLASHFVLDGAHLTVAPSWTAPESFTIQWESCLSSFISPEGLSRMAPAMWYGQSRVCSANSSEYAKKLAAQIAESFKNTADDDSAHVIKLSATMQGGSYVRGQRSETHKVTICRVLEAHPGLNSALMGLTFDEQYRAVLDLAKRAKAKEGQLIYGLAETMATPIDLWNAHNREQFYKQLERESPGPLACQPYFETVKQNGWTIRELCTRSALRAEGVLMNHCVGGYYSKVCRGTSRILTIRHDSNHKWASTVELSGDFRATGHVRIVQHHSYQNKVPPAACVEVLNTFLKQESARLGFSLNKPVIKASRIEEAFEL